MVNNSLISKNFDRDLESYLSILRINFPQSHINKIDLRTFFKLVNNTFILSDVLTDFEIVEKESNIYNMMMEYKQFYARLLTTMALNDPFLINNLLRLIVEKLYRMVYGISYPNRGENRIRRLSREKMDFEINSWAGTENAKTINNLYRDLSKSIHHTISDKYDLVDIQEKLRYETNIVPNTVVTLESIEVIFVEEIFKVLLYGKQELVSTNLRARIANNVDSVLSSELLKTF